MVFVGLGTGFGFNEFVIAGSLIGLAGSVVFLLGCIVFLIPFIWKKE